MKLSKNALTVLEKRYLMKDEQGQPVEGAEEMFRRVADTIAAGDKLYDPNADVASLSDRFYQLMTDLEFLPNSPTLMNAGRDLGQLSACFVLPVEDSMEDIFEAVKNAALIHKSGGGTGFSFSRLRQQGATVRSTGGVASGPVSFMRVFNMATEAVKQGGTRRGANMGILRVDHPDILAFIDCKKDNADITNFNISVGITEAFMEAVEQNTTYDLIDPKTGEAVGSLGAVSVFDKIVDAAWRNGEPGIVFLDRLNRDNVVPGQGKIESTNPCGEQPLLPYEACNLGSINLAAMLREEDGVWSLDYGKLEQVIADAVHFLDNVIDVNKYPLEKIGAMTRSTRKIGLGVMGYADMLLRLGVGYNSDAAVALAQEVMAFVQDKAWAASRQLALARGAFPLFEESTFKDGPLVRNATVTTIAPTGTLSIIAGCSSGVEPVFAYVYLRNVMDNTEMIESNPILEEVLRQRGLYSPELMRKIAAEGTLAHLEELPQDLRDVFVCSHDISPLYHIRTQAAFQQHTDNAVSKTVNFTHDATPEDVREVYLLAYQEGCKGVTIYRDGSREGQVLNIGAPKSTEATPEEEARELLELEPQGELDRVTRAAYGEVRPRPRPEVTYGLTERMKIGCGNLYVTVNYDENGICEVFTSTGKAGGCPSQSEATARLVSIALRSGVDPQEILDQLRGIRCPSTIRQPGMKCTSCPDAIAKVVKKVSQYIRELPPQEAGSFQPIPAMAMANAAPDPARPRAAGPTGGREMTQAEAKLAKFCPECGAALEHEGGCVSCRSCGFSKCG